MNPIVSTPIKYLKNADYNPICRIKEQKIKPLMLSMEAYGLIYPVLIDKEKVIIEGHRRVAAAKLLGWKEINTQLFEGDATALYASINTTSRRMGSNEIIGVYLKNPLAVAPKQRERVKRMVDCLGRRLTERIFNLGYSIVVFETAIRIITYCDQHENNELLKKTVEWLINMPVMGDARKALHLGESPKLLMKAIKEMKPVEFRLHVA